MLMLASGCASNTAEPPQPEPSTSTPASSQATPWDHDSYEPVEQVEPTASAGELADVAKHFIEVYGGDYDDHDQWWQHVEPLVAQGQREKFRSVGLDAVAQIDLTITGDITIEDQSSPFVATATVPTAAGTIHLVMSCASKGQPWLVESMSR